LRERFGVSALSVFGSRARGEAREDSDLDLLIDFEPDARPTLFSLARMNAMLEAEVGVKVDTVLARSLREEFRFYVERDLIHV
jgi:predicted nucleotidyltransferase